MDIQKRNRRKRKMNKLSLKSIVFVIIFVFCGVFFVIDPFDYWTYEVGYTCTPESQKPRCTGRVILPWQ